MMQKSVYKISEQSDGISCELSSDRYASADRKRQRHWTVFEADRYRDFTQEELRLLINDLADNWSELENIQLKGHHLYNLSPNTG